MEALKLQPSLARAHAARGWGVCRSGRMKGVVNAPSLAATMKGGDQWLSNAFSQGLQSGNCGWLPA